MMSNETTPLHALLNDSTRETWAAARDRQLRAGLTLFMAVAAIEPRLTADPEKYVPDAVTVARALWKCQII